MSVRNLSLTPRGEETRDKQTIVPVVEFDLLEIKSRFDTNIESINRQFAIADKLNTEGNIEECENIWRSQIIFLESALDFYIHEISKYGMISIFTGKWSKTEKYNNYQIPMKYVEEGFNNLESKDWLLLYLNDRLSTEVYLSADSMKNQLNLLGINFEPVMKKAFSNMSENDTSFQDGRKIVKDLFERRNQIAHQSDRKHNDATKNIITKEYVEKCISDVVAIVNSIQEIAVSKSM